MAASCNPLHFSLPLPSRHRSLPTSSSVHTPPAAAAFPAYITSIIHPSVQNAQVLFYKSGYNVQIAVEEDESEEVLLRRFKREVSKAGVIQEFRRRSHFENKQEEKKRKAQEAGRRNRFRRSGFRFTPTPRSGDGDGDAPKSAREDADDNWDLPEGNLPY